MMGKRVELHLSLAALVVAVLAFGVSWWQLEVTRVHNSLSVRPYILITPHIEGESGRNGLYISNEGLGTGLIKGLRVTVGGMDFQGLGESRWPDVLRKTELSPECFTKAWPLDGAAIRSGAEQPLLAFSKTKDSPFCKLQLISFLTRDDVGVELRYASMYGEEFIFKGSFSVNEKILLGLSEKK